MTSRVGLASLSDVMLVDLPQHVAENGELIVLEGTRHVPFAIARAFYVRAAEGAIRGQHAHRQCSQFLNCAAGAIEVLCDDGASTGTYVLDRPDRGLLVPAGVWSQQTYRISGSVLLVLCDRPYEAHDYIREYGDFERFRGSAGGGV